VRKKKAWRKAVNVAAVFRIRKRGVAAARGKERIYFTTKGTKDIEK